MISVFLPTRRGSERCVNKNTRDFANISGGLLKLKLTQLIESKSVSEIVLSTNDSISADIGRSFGSKKIKIVERPDELALSSTSLMDLIDYVPSICAFDHILWTHVTSPFVLASDYDLIVHKYFEAIKSGFDSLMSVRPLRNFIWDGDVQDIVNRLNCEQWPRTQDLKVLFEVNSAVFVNSKIGYSVNRNRIGKLPYLFEMSDLKGFDIDWEEDFLIAEKFFKAVYE
jgi:CMP-N-acetylneuraminic acid synthetase